MKVITEAVTQLTAEMKKAEQRVVQLKQGLRALRALGSFAEANGVGGRKPLSVAARARIARAQRARWKKWKAGQKGAK